MRCLCDLHSRLRWATAVLLGLALAACGEGLLELQDLSNQDGLTSLITLDEFEQTLDQTTRVEIKLLPDALVARQVELETDADEINDEEEIESRIVALAADGTEGALTLLLGNLQVRFTDQTRFRRDGGDDLTFAEFVARVADDLANDRQPPVRAERRPGAEPQAPDDPTFIATQIRLEDDEDREPEIEINIDADNLVMNDAPSPDAWINVLGLAIELRINDGTTELEGDGDDDDNEGPDDADDEDEFEATVTAVDVEAGTFTLEGGTIVRIDPERTKIDSEGDLTTLIDVNEALEAGKLVRAEGDAVPESPGPPLQLLALKVKFEIDDEDEEEDEQRVGDEEDFEDTIASLAVDEISTLVLDNGTVVLIDGNTEIKQSGDEKSLNSLQEVVDALNAGHAVETKGKGTVQDIEPLTILADEIEFEREVEDDEEGEEQEPVGTEEDFEDTVASLVTAEVSTVTLTNGTVVLIDGNTEIKQSGDEKSLNSLQEVVDALNAGRTVETKGKGIVQGVEPLTILADEIEFELVEKGS